jgi:hypothetical protein
VNVLCCDGHVQFVKDSISLPAWRGLSTRTGGEVISADCDLRRLALIDVRPLLQ